MNYRIAFISILLAISCSSKQEQQKVSNTKPAPASVVEKITNEKEEILETPIAKYEMSLFGEYSVELFVKSREEKLANIDTLTFEDISDYYIFEGGRDFIYPQLHAVDSGIIEFFDPFNSSLKPTIEYFHENEINEEHSISYNETYLASSNFLKSRFNHFVTGHDLGDNSIFIAVNESTNDASIIQLKKNQKLSEFEIPCPMNITKSWGFAKTQTNVGNYLLQQSIYFDIFKSFLFITVDDFNYVAVFDRLTEEFLLCADISQIVKIPVFVGITKENNILFFDDYDESFKLIDENVDLIDQFEIEHRNDLSGVNYSLDRTSNILYMSGMDEKSLIQKIYSNQLIFDSTEEYQDENDCVFNNDIKGQSIETLLKFDSTLNYVWNEESKEVTTIIDNDTVYVSIGGCYHYNFAAGLRTNKQNFDDTIYWFNKAKWLANSFLWVGEDYTRVIDNGLLIKSDHNTLNEIQYNFPPDTTITNIYIEGVTISRSPVGTSVEVGGYMN